MFICLFNCSFILVVAGIQGFGSTVFASGRGLVSKLVKPEEQGMNASSSSHYIVWDVSV